MEQGMIHTDSEREIMLRLDIAPSNGRLKSVHDYNWEKAAGYIYLSLENGTSANNPHVRVKKNAPFPFLKAAVVRRYERQERVD